MNGYYLAAKQKISTKLQSYWQKDSTQAVYQGLSAPIYSRVSFQNLVSASEDLQTALSRAVTENAGYALRALISYFVYYRVVHPTLQEYQDDLSSNSWVDSTAQTVINGIDLTLYMAMMCYLVTYGWQNSAQNMLFTSAITTTAGNAMKPSPDFKPCDQKECGAVTMARAGLDSGFFYLANRYIVSNISWNITHSMPGVYGKILAFGLEAVSIGLPLVEYKFSAVGQCTLHKYKEMLGSYKTYCIMYGASFVAATWGSYKALSWLSGEENPYIYNAVYSLMFQMYLVLAIAREKKFPGNDHVNFDVMKWLIWFAEKPITVKTFRWLLGSLSSAEEFVQSPGAGIAISVNDREIKQGLNSVKGGIQQVRGIQNSWSFSTLRWINNLLPNKIISDEVTKACQSVSKSAISRSIRRVEYVLEVGRTAELQRNVQTQQPIIVETVNDHFALSRTSIQKNKQTDETNALPMFQVSEPDLPRSRTYVQIEETKSALPVELKLDVPKESKPEIAEQKFDVILQTEIVNSSYFAEEKNTELKRVRSPVYVSPQSSTLFAKKEGDIFRKGMPKKQDSLACVTASIISNVARAKALR